MKKIRVAVRVRPAVIVSEDTTSNGTCWKVEENCIWSLHKSHGTPISGISYAFGTWLYYSIPLYFLVHFCILFTRFFLVDHVFDESCTNSRVYSSLPRILFMLRLTVSTVLRSIRGVTLFQVQLIGTLERQTWMLAAVDLTRYLEW